MSGPSKFYVTTFCNFAHRIKDGKPIGHECYVLPTEALVAERDGRMEHAQDILSRWKKRATHKGLKETTEA